MSPLTPKQRARIYRKAAERVFENDFMGVHLCWTLTAITNYYSYKMKILPELFQLGKNPDEFWKPYTDKNSRILALLFAEQMALKP